MKVFRELTFESTPDNLLAFVQCIESSLTDGWRRDLVRESERLTENDYVGTTRFDRVFHCSSSAQRVAAHLWIVARTEDSLFVSNIVPVEVDQLTYDQYNAILEQFYDRFAKKAATENNVVAHLGPSEWSPEENLPETVARTLQNFCAMARRYSGLAHPADEERWQNFIIAAHESNCDLDGSTLGRWLREDEHWPEVFVNKLVGEYETGRTLLARAYQPSLR